METDKRAILNFFAEFHILIFDLQLSYCMLRRYHPAADRVTEELRHPCLLLTVTVETFAVAK